MTTKKQLSDTEVLVNTLLDEQGILETLRNNITLLRKHDENNLNIIEYTRLIKADSETVPIREYLGENFWCLLVLLYGEYGVTLRSGWITEKQAFFNMLLYNNQTIPEEVQS